MLSFFVLIALIGLFFFSTYIEKKLLGNYFTPYFFLMAPFLVICSINILFHPFMGSPIIDYRVLLLWVVYSFAFLVGGVPLLPFITKNKLQPEEKTNRLRNVSLASILMSLVLIIIAINILRTNGSLHYLASDGYAKEYGQGLASLLRISTMITLIYLIGFTKPTDKLAISAIVITIIPFLLYQVKGLFFIPVVSGIIFRIIRGKLNISVKLIVKIVGMGMIVFFVFYTIPYIYLGETETILSFKFIQERFISFYAYLVSGILAFTRYIQTDLHFVDEPQRIIAPLWNALRRVTGWPRVENIVTEYRFVINSTGSSSNVFTIFGTIHGYLGFQLTFLFSMAIGFISYFMKLVADNTKNVWLQISHAFNLSILAFGWFDYYYNYSFIIILWVFNLILFFGSSIKHPKIVLKKAKHPYLK